ncbi:MAG: Na(+)-translocating NADH-quinone reductase subunit A [Candidatus Hydrogenedentes bacterium]|nr:Na(+)-translocating NADH-quinone reductase subunit A [Candidatus Hydrogenedentota bacterium]
MAEHVIKKGLDLPLGGAPEQTIEPGRAVASVAVLADDYVGMRPTMQVQVGDRVRRGQPLFEDKKSPGTVYTAPGAGTITAIHRGERRALRSVVIELTETERGDATTKDDLHPFESYTGKDPASLSRDEVRALLIESGMWASFRTRPFSKVPRIDAEPDAIFITAIDTNPLAADVDVVYAGNEEAFERGLLCIAKLREGRLYLCKGLRSKINAGAYSGIQEERFGGPHPSGTVGLHIHLLDPVHRDKTIWHLNYQDVIAIGNLFITGELDVIRVVSLAGPSVKRPRLLETRIGARLDELTADELVDGEHRTISGSVLSGRTAQGDVEGYLGRHHHQISVLREGREREFLGWLGPGSKRHSVLNVFLSRLLPSAKYEFTTTTNGSARAMVPIGSYERVMPMDILPTFLLRSLIMGDVERAEKLGCLELDEEDLALCTYVCPGKYDYGPYLRKVLTTIEREG